MSIRTMPLREALQHLDAQLKELLSHPETTQQDKASITMAGTNLSAIARRHLGKWTPCNPKSLPPRKPGQQYPRLPKGWAVDWEEQTEAANA